MDQLGVYFQLEVNVLDQWGYSSGKYIRTERYKTCKHILSSNVFLHRIKAAVCG